MHPYQHPPASSESSRFQKASWATLAIALFFLTLGALFVWSRVTGPSDGARLQPGASVWSPNGVVVTPLQEKPYGLLPGDLVVAVEGRSMESWAQALFSPWKRPDWQMGQTVTYTVVREGRPTDVRVTLGRYPLGAILAQEWGAIVFALALLLVAAFVFLKRPREPASRILLLGASGMVSATTWSFGLQVSDLLGGIGLWQFKATSVVGFLLLWVSLVHLWLVFPRPLVGILRQRWAIPFLYGAPYVALAVHAGVMWSASRGILDWLGRMDRAVGFVEIGYLSMMLLAVVWQYRTAEDPVNRLQVRWVVFATLLSGGLGMALVFLPQVLLGHPLIGWNAMALFGLPVPIATAFAILRYHLFDIEVVINRTLVYGTLTAVTIGLYVLIVGLVGALFQTRGNLGIALLAAGLVAVLFQPLRQRLQNTINRWMYGHRDDPYGVLTRLGHRLEGALPVESILPAVVDTVAQALKIPYVAIALSRGQEQVVVAAHGLPTPDTLKLPLVYQGEELGQMLLAPRAPGEAFNRADWRLLSDLARQTGVVAHSIRLTEDLRRARGRLVISREEERRHLRRDLHDGLGPILGGMTLKLDAARNVLARDPVAADAMLAEVKAQTQKALADIRRLAYALRPPALDQLGLVMALGEHAASFQSLASDGEFADSYKLRVRFDVPSDLPPLPAAAEVATYRIAVEALANVARHSRAHNCTVRLSLPEEGILELDVADDGVGLPPVFGAGVGITSMKERAVELGGSCVVESVPGGGTRVRARIPVGVHQEPATGTEEEKGRG